MSALPALHGGKGPVGAIRGVGAWVGAGVGVAAGVAEALAEGLAVAAGDGLVVSEGLGVGAAIAGLENRANAKEAAALAPAEILKKLATD